MDILEHKRELRKQMIIERAQIDNLFKKKYDLWICDQLEHIILSNNFKTVHAYLPMGKEINITPLLFNLLNNNIKVITPKTLPKRQLQNLELISLEEIEQGVYGTSHPANSYEYTGNYDLIITPGLAFDKNNYRLGYGGGYYDKFLVKHANALKVGIFYPFQQVEKVPVEKHDLQLDRVISGSGFRVS